MTSKTGEAKHKRELERVQNAGKECRRNALVTHKINIKSTILSACQTYGIFLMAVHILCTCSKHSRSYYLVESEKASFFISGAHISASGYYY